MEMLAALGSCDFYEKDYAGALEAFNAVNPDGLTGKALADYHFQRGFALMDREIMPVLMPLSLKYRNGPPPIC